MKAHNALETATNTIENTLVVEELSDADLMAISGGGVLDNLAQNALQYANLQNVAQYAAQNLLQGGVNVG